MATMETLDYSVSRTEYLRKNVLSGDVADFPIQKLQIGNGKGPRVVLIACGSYSPITFMHLRMFEQARDFGAVNGLNIIGGYFSPVTDAYKKKGLVSAEHRVKMCELATESSEWITVDKWESQQSQYLTTVVVLEHFAHCLNKNLKQGEDPIQVKLLCGGDLLESFNKPGVWAAEDIRDIVEKFGLVVLDRDGSRAFGSITENDVLFKYQNNIKVMQPWVANDLSSTKMRQLLARGNSIRYLTPDSVANYIKEKKLFI